MRTWFRIFLIGGLMSFRALFSWISPWVYIPTLLVTPVFQIVFFAYLGRTAHLRSDGWFVIGNAVQVASFAALFGMGFAIDGERWQQTLSSLLATPANRTALFLGRALPVLANAAFVSGFSFLAAGLLLGYHPPLSAAPTLALIVVLGAFSCTGLGMVTGSVALRIRDMPILANLVMAILLIFCGTNVPLDRLPGWMSTISQGLPLTHAIAAARRIADGASLGSVDVLVAKEIGLGLAYMAVGFALLRWFEIEGRKHATLDRL